VDNTAWLRDLKYIDFLRDIGRHFSVNRMLAAESYRQRLDTGLSFLEFNYMLLQSYDFLVLYQKHRCLLQLGGQDQWGNIVAGSDLIRRVEGAQAYGLTFPLLTSSTGEKFGKSVAGAVWLSAERTSTFDFYQFWRNVEDRDVERLLKLFTFLPVEECERLGRLVPPLLNRAKEILAYEVTRFVHGAEAAAEAYLAATAHFPSADPTRSVPTSSGLMALGGGEDRSLPELALSALQLAAGLSIADLLVLAGMATSKGEARRLVRQGGVRLADQPVTDENLPISPTLLSSSPILKAGKKRMVRLTAGSGAKGAS
jgi:tyrosyl-tRNA synthetase